MNIPADATIRATILAGTVAERPDMPGDLPRVGFGAPEPWWTEHTLRQMAPPDGAPAAIAGDAWTDAPHRNGVVALLSGYAAGAFTPVDVVAALRARSAAHPSGADAVLRPLADAEAMAEDSRLRWRQGRARLLEGVPFGVKDLIDVAGARVTSGSHQTGERVAAADATVVARLRAQGAIPFAMLGTTEFACGSAHNPRYGAVSNPWVRTRWTGGSSTGSGAALAARLLPLALGTDTGGSVRVPAAWCGVTGLKPTRGLVPRTGVASLSWTLDHVGPMARSALDLAAVMPCIAGPDGEDGLAAGGFRPRARGLAGLRVGVPGGWFVELQDATVLAAWRAALEVLAGAGAIMVPVDLGDIARAHLDGYAIVMAELASLQEPELERMQLFDAGTRARIETGRTLRAIDYLRALRRRPLVQRAVLAAMADVDVLVTPGLGSEAARLDDLTVEVDGARHPLQEVLPRNTMIFNMTGQPALMLPSGMGRGGLPLAIQVVGKLFDDGLVLAVGAAFQQLTAHHLSAPPEP